LLFSLGFLEAEAILIFFTDYSNYAYFNIKDHI